MSMSAWTPTVKGAFEEGSKVKACPSSEPGKRDQAGRGGAGQVGSGRPDLVHNPKQLFPAALDQRLDLLLRHVRERAADAGDQRAQHAGIHLLDLGGRAWARTMICQLSQATIGSRCDIEADTRQHPRFDLQEKRRRWHSPPHPGITVSRTVTFFGALGGFLSIGDFPLPLPLPLPEPSLVCCFRNFLSSTLYRST